MVEASPEPAHSRQAGAVAPLQLRPGLRQLLVHHLVHDLAPRLVRLQSRPALGLRWDYKLIRAGWYRRGGWWQTRPHWPVVPGGGSSPFLSTRFRCETT